tara:strand:- start:246 stop:443 length:198 start_codon:yes stop_codon:yes gene_type:complete
VAEVQKSSTQIFEWLYWVSQRRMDRAMTVDAEELVAAYETSRVALGCLDKSPLSSTGRDLLRIKS